MSTAVVWLKLAAMLTLIGVIAPLFATVLIGETVGLGFAYTVILFVGWFVQGLVIFALPLLLLARFAGFTSARAYIISAIVVMVLISVGLAIDAADATVPVAFSTIGTLLFLSGAICAGYYLFRRRAALTRTV